MTENQAPETAFFIGDVAVDDYFTADRWPGLADKAAFSESTSYVGGMIANAASVHAGLGGATEFISLLNHGALSQRLCEDLGEHGVGTAHMLYDPNVPDSRNMIFLVGGEHVVLYVETGDMPMVLAEPALAALQSPGFLYTTLSRAKRLRAGELAGAEVLAQLRGYGRRTVFDLDVEGFEPGDEAYLEGAEVVVMNEIGFGLSFGSPNVSAVNTWMAEYGVKAVIRTLAAAGAELYDGEGVTLVPGHRVDVMDVTGAGDTFGGALVFALSSMASMADALSFAVAAASRAVTIEGPRGGVATREEVERFREASAVAAG
ncbi:carbohydrate kinase family protein [Arthrobacter sp. ERGS1:01]|uniref:carbohydrate kinase family protein n=1 Tax=Arthrobacter sp. ERGS1:01 TaxID=1704044 RepID=UPI0006B54F46|nr:carbohydrate kinase family protein [Arthrobacter sp. ERGS1:01]